jgi:hypothetical protein
LFSQSDVQCGSKIGLSQQLPIEMQQFTQLFNIERHHVMSELDKLPELADQDKLQLKILFTVIVVSYRSYYKHTTCNISCHIVR